jgi:hypothetical protein
MPCALGKDALRGVQVRYGECSESGSSGTKLGWERRNIRMSLGSIWFNHICAAYRFHEAVLSIRLNLLIDSMTLPLSFLLTLAHSPFDLLPLDHWVLFCHIMSFLGRVIPVRLRKRSNGDLTPKYSIAAGLSTASLSAALTVVPGSVSRAPVTVNKQSDLPGHLLTLTFQGDSFMRRANNVIREGLNVLSPIAGGIPVAGTPLKASIDALLVVLNTINVSQRIPEYRPCVIDHGGRKGARIKTVLPT